MRGKTEQWCRRRHPLGPAARGSRAVLVSGRGQHSYQCWRMVPCLEQGTRGTLGLAPLGLGSHFAAKVFRLC